MNSLEESDIYQKIGAEVRRLAQKFGIDDIELASEVSTLTKLSKELAIEKTNKRIVLGLEELANTKLGKSVYQDGIRQGIRESQKYISDLLEDKK